MISTYAQKQSPAQKKDDSSAVSVHDTSSQSESLQRKANLANNITLQMGDRVSPIQKIPTKNAIQAKLIINSWKKGYTETIKNILTQMVNPNPLKFKNNWITPLLKCLGLTSSTTVEKGNNFNSNGRKSAQLIERLIDGGKTTLITSTKLANRAQPLPQNNELVADTLRNSSYGEQNYGEGRNANVYINVNSLEGASSHTMTSVKTKDGKDEPQPNKILLGHELIHADRINRGAAKLTFPLEEAYYAKKHKTSLEDIFTIGLQGKKGDWHYDGEDIANPDGDAITENDLRREYNLSERIAY